MASKSIKYYLKNPRAFLHGVACATSSLWSDKKYLKILYRINFGKKLNLDNPQTYNEKLQWLKLYNQRPEYTDMVDKIKVKKFVADKIGEEYIIPTLGVWDNPDDIDFDQLPDKFVLKCNHDSGGLCICTDKSALNRDKVIKNLKKGLKRDYYKCLREWPYKNVERKILAEQYMETPDGDLPDYKFFCFNGEVKAMFIATDRFTPGEETKFDFFDRKFNHLPFENGHPNSKVEIDKPKHFEKMVQLAEKLSEGIPHARIDFYDIDGKIYFGEITFFHWSGFVPFKPEEWDTKFGEWIELPEKNN